MRRIQESFLFIGMDWGRRGKAAKHADIYIIDAYTYIHIYYIVLLVQGRIHSTH